MGEAGHCCDPLGAIWVSENGLVWTRVDDDDFAHHWRPASVWSSKGRLLAYGDSGLFGSTDGNEWTPIPIGDAPADFLGTPIKANGSLTYIVSSGASRSPLELWRLDASGWTRLGPLPLSDGASFQMGAGGWDGRVALGERWHRRGRVESLAWASEDGATWQLATNTAIGFCRDGRCRGRGGLRGRWV